MSIDGRKGRKNKGISEAGPYTKEEQKYLELMKAAKKQYLKEKPSTKWKDLPPVLNPKSILTQIVLENALTNGDKAQVGDTYLEFATNIEAIRPVKFTKKNTIPVPFQERHQTEEDVDVKERQGVIIIGRGYKVWQVLQPEWTEKDQERIDKIHDKYAANYGHKKEYQDKYEQPPVKRWPKDKFPNGLYWTERWVPKVWNDVTKEWLPASEKDCQNWDSIPKEKKRVDFLFGVLPSDEEED